MSDIKSNTTWRKPWMKLVKAANDNYDRNGIRRQVRVLHD